MIKHKIFLTLSLILTFNYFFAQNSIPSEHVLSNKELGEYLNNNTKNNFTNSSNISEAVLAKYFRTKFKERYFYNWETTGIRFSKYESLYNNQLPHKDRANDHMEKFAANTTWKLPFNYLNGKEVNAYALRHLARQHKMVDIALMYYYDNKDEKYINYFTGQQTSLNLALANNTYETIKDGNGIYEAFRSGYRVLNWLQIHNLFLGEDAYSDSEQLQTIATLLQHASHLYINNPKFRSGNHQTRGMSALAMLSILFRDFKDADLWFEHSMNILGEHLDKEINEDGFQFERSVHYHMSDIENYFYVYQLAKISNLQVSETWENQLKTLFTTLVKVAYPDKSAPVLQDDTNIPWAEKNDISGTMTLGYLLFEDQTFGYFANDNIESKLYWFLQQKQLDRLTDIQSNKPSYHSLDFDKTNYYIMREGWNNNDKMMIISAGVDEKKPDHQHGDILGIQAMANGQVILPNYQVRYSLSDYEFFKNSMVKNVALVDDELQGKLYKSNKGGSGFGKFKELPIPKVISWISNDHFDAFAGSHNGFKNIDVSYSRQVIYIKDDFWIVKDNFQSAQPHTYKQVWQGHYTHEEGSDLIRATFSDASGCDIFQLNTTDTVIKDGKRGKEWSTVEKHKQDTFSFITLIYPYKGYNNRIPEENNKLTLNNWLISDCSKTTDGKCLSNGNESILLSIDLYIQDDFTLRFAKTTDIAVIKTENEIKLFGLGKETVELKLKGKKTFKLNDEIVKDLLNFSPGDRLTIE